MIGHMQAYKRGLRVTRDHPITRRQQLGLGRIILSVKRPVRMMPQLFPSLVEAIHGREEGVGIGRMNEHRQLQFPSRFPHGIEARIVDFHQRPGLPLLAQIQAQNLQHLHSHGSRLLATLDLIRLPLRKAGLANSVVGGLYAVEETAPVALLQIADVLPQTRSVAAGQVDHGAQVDLVHPGDHGIDAAQCQLGRAAGARPWQRRSHMRVNVDHGVFRASHGVLGHHQHAAGLEIFQCQTG